MFLRMGMAFLALGWPLAGGELLPGGDAEQGNIWDSDKVILVEDDRAPGNKVFSLAEPAFTVLSRPIPVDTAKTYRLSATVRSADPESPTTACLGLVPLDARERPLLQGYVNAREGTETTLAAAAEAGAEKLLVVDAAPWEKRRSVRTLVAFQAKPEYADLPNFQLSPLVTRVKKTADGEAWEITLEKPLPWAFAAGTPVRQHLYGAHLYNLAAYRKIPGAWTELSADIGGSAPVGAPFDRFWAGTAFVRVLVMSDAARLGAGLLFDDVRFVEVEPAP